MKGTTLNGMMKKIVKIMNAINSGNYGKTHYSRIYTYCLVDVALVGEVQPGQFHWEPDDNSDDKRKDVDDVRRQHPQLVDYCRKNHTQVEHVVEKVIVK